MTINKVAKTSTNPGQILLDSLNRFRIDLATMGYFFLRFEDKFFISLLISSKNFLVFESKTTSLF